MKNLKSYMGQINESKDLSKETQLVEKIYNELNKKIFNFSSLNLIDLLYPNHDGKMNDEVAANLLYMQDDLNLIKMGCEKVINDIYLLIED